MKGFIVAGTGSGSGKTTLSMGIMAYLAGLGYRVAPFKVGPDFIDPGHHTALTGVVSRNLDSWMLSKSYNRSTFVRGCRDADIAVVEGVMGLFDGYSGTSEAGSTAQMAKWLNLPVLLVVDARSMARSAAAIVQGFENFDKGLTFAGVIFSKTGSHRHYEYLKAAVSDTCRMKCLGHMPRNENIIMPERHLGLVTSDEHLMSSDTTATLVKMIEQHTRIGKMVEALSGIAPFPEGSVLEPGISSNAKTSDTFFRTEERMDSFSKHHEKNGEKKSSCAVYSRRISDGEQRIRVAVARDSAFCFYYPENIEALENLGVRVVTFSPMEDEALPRGIHGIYLGGGYPELFAKQLADNVSLRKEIKGKSLKGMPIYGECGGFMYLCTCITDMDGGKSYPMVGCFPFTATMSGKMRALGYREITLTRDTLVGNKGDVLRGHEFHYSSLNESPGTLSASENGEDILYDDVYRVTKRDGIEAVVHGFQCRNTLGSYVHAHFGSTEGAAQAFVRACENYNIAGEN